MIRVSEDSCAPSRWRPYQLALKKKTRLRLNAILFRVLSFCRVSVWSVVLVWTSACSWRSVSTLSFFKTSKKTPSEHHMSLLARVWLMDMGCYNFIWWKFEIKQWQTLFLVPLRCLTLWDYQLFSVWHFWWLLRLLKLILRMAMS